MVDIGRELSPVWQAGYKRRFDMVAEKFLEVERELSELSEFEDAGRKQGVDVGHFGRTALRTCRASDHSEALPYGDGSMRSGSNTSTSDEATDGHWRLGCPRGREGGLGFSEPKNQHLTD